MATNVHRLKVEGQGRIKHYKCACGNWTTTGSQGRDKGIRAAHSQHVSQAASASPRSSSEGDQESSEA